MEHAVASFADLGEFPLVYVHADILEVLLVLQMGDVLRLVIRDHVCGDDPVSFLDEFVYELASDETGSAGDDCGLEHIHSSLLYMICDPDDSKRNGIQRRSLVLRRISSLAFSLA